MPFNAVEESRLRSAITRLRNEYSPLTAGAAECVDAAIWLLGGYRIPQALSLFPTAIEQTLKGELAQIHPAFIVDPRRWGYEQLKALFADAFRKHPKAVHLDL